jgi:NAD(P)-dependent dehydrogenase (short-subunit alcohol dehydrogenase family)
MTDKKIWLITGAGRGLGLDIAKAALAAGHAVVATGRDPAKVTAAIGHHDDLLAIKLDVTRPEDSHAAVAAAVTKFGRIDVLVNNAGNFYAGFFEELSPDQVRNQIETLLFGPMSVTSGRLAGDAEAALGPAPDSLLDRRHHRPNVLHSICCSEVRYRRMD